MTQLDASIEPVHMHPIDGPHATRIDASRRTTDDSVLVLDNVTLRRGGRHILSDVDLIVRPGEHWAVLGPNGAGKSTMLSLCGAERHPTSGTVRVLGRQLGRVEIQALRVLIGHVNPRHPIDGSLAVDEVVLSGFTGALRLPRTFSPSAEQLDKTQALIEVVGLAASRGLIWANMSQGERGRALIARALVSRPPLLLLDEPTTGLDLAAREQLLSTIDAVANRTPETASVLITHHLEELPKTTSHAALLRDGRLLAAGPAEEVLTSQNVTEAFEYPIDVSHVAGRWVASGGGAFGAS